jgi:electron transport complex protein RnfG
MAHKLESTLSNMVLSLTLISLIMSAALSVVYLKTREPIELAGKKKEKAAIEKVVPAFDSIVTSGIRNFDGCTVYPLRTRDSIVGYAVKTYTDLGFSGHIELIAGFLPDGSVYDTQVLHQRETPGLGTKMTEPKFKDQFKGKNPSGFVLKVKKDGGQVDAITAATISSRAYCDALQRAYVALHAIDSISVNN